MLVDYIWYFFIYAVLGWCTEVIFAAVNTGKFVNRGFLNGPLCPMYGVGVAVIVFCLSPLEDNVWLTFLTAVVLTSGLEWITGFVLEKLFHQRWWDYSELPFNIGGYICLKFSLAWGLACLLILKVIHPGIAALVHHIPFMLSCILLPIFGALLICDLVFTVISVRSLNVHLEQLSKVTSMIRAASDDIGGKMSEQTIKLMHRQSELMEHLRGGEKRLMAAFPQMRSTRYADLMEKLREKHFHLSEKKQQSEESHS